MLILGSGTGALFEFLEITATDLGKPIRRLMVGKLARAYNYLRLRNEEEMNRLVRGEKWFAYGLSLLLIVLLVYLLLSIDQKASPKEADNDNNGRSFSVTIRYGK